MNRGAGQALCLLDTHVVLDWVLFDDPRCHAWVEAIRRQRLRWIYSPDMLAEALRVVHYPAVARRHDPRAATISIEQCFDHWGQCCVAPRTQHILRCTDPDDQMFLDLALEQRATWLLSRDRALLRLARHASGHGLLIQPPERTAPAI